MAQKKTSESLTCSAASEVSASDLKQPDLFKLSDSVNKTPSAKPSSESTGLTHQSTTMSEPSTQMDIEELTSCVEGFLAKTSVLLDLEKDLRVRDQDCGASSTELLATYDPNTSSWKTSQRCFIGEWGEFSETWPRSGLMRNGIAFRLPTLAEPISGIGCLSLPTPTARDWKGSRSLISQQKTGRGITNSLPDYLRIKGNWQYPPVQVVEYMMGFPKGWLDCKRWETASTSHLSNKSAKQSLKRKKNETR